MAEVGTGMAAILLSRPAPWAQVCSLAGVMMSAAEKSVAAYSGCRISPR